jgi:hypothetical protein
VDGDGTGRGIVEHEVRERTAYIYPNHFHCATCPLVWLATATRRREFET